ncbi:MULTISPECIES: flagellar hook-associated protein 3 [Pseudomonas]|uniref:Flagellar hook-associated protein 3 n=5 Tax=Pseudomonas fluorescens group TaxID=136843 RepID=C3K0V6_PSEFS|nr:MULTISPECIES: flagellar hook-associated protein 3 [Pseudomonas]KJZ53473.1 flagellar hook protein FlgL [Pseudomonas marginalis]KJZ55054.1 flagellar hook protein FlgL [Pseudomonas marginalis]MBZ6455214.1 flagellar hook-associated protein 3 [Pseudomonas fluorescens group sp.]MBZ6463135.1 flagellar hook-associated protein 3 [Pseudomonas fluorescens group sp.]MBZ6468492.1 flagellar hook-associated protein 3 [Pseudomonas fluorescens group sp.]
MRISTQQYFDTSAAKYQNNYSGVVQAQEQASSGVRVQTAGDDPVAAQRLLMLQQQKDMLAQFSGNISNIQSSLTNEESVLTAISATIQAASQLALKAGGVTSDADRKSISVEVGALEDQLLGLLNSKDAAGNYLFSGSKTETPPYSRNIDGTYNYQGDENELSLQVSETLTVRAGDTGKTILEGAANNSRTQTKYTTPAPVPPATTPSQVDDNKVAISAGLVTSGVDYNKSFADGQPYKLTFTSSTQYVVTDKNNNDITSQLPGNGTFDSTKEGSASVNLRGVKFDITVDLTDKATGPDADAMVKGREFSLSAKPDVFNVSRTASNTSATQLTNATVSSPAKYASTFPANSGVVIKFSDTDPTAFQVFTQPYSANSKAIDSGVIDTTTTPNSITAAGVTFGLSGTPNVGDQFSVGASTQKTQSALDTLSQLRKALEQPADGIPGARIKLQDALNSAVSNLTSSSDQVDNVRGSIGARQNALTVQSSENESVGLANKTTMSALANIDMGEAAINLTLQQTMLEASQLAFVKISQLSLFNKM